MHVFFCYYAPPDRKKATGVQNDPAVSRDHNNFTEGEGRVWPAVGISFPKVFLLEKQSLNHDVVSGTID